MKGTQIYDNVAYYFNELKIAIYGVFVYLNIDIKTTKVLMALMFIDTFSGLIKSSVLHHKISLKKLINGILTKFLLILVPMVLALVGKGVHFDFTWAVTTVMSLMIVSEGLSIITNFLSAKTKKNIEQDDFITKLLMNIRKMFGSILTQLFDKLNSVKVTDLDEKRDEEK